MKRQGVSIVGRSVRPGTVLTAAACIALLGVAQVVETAPPPKRAAFVHEVVTGAGGNVCGTFAGDTVIDHPLANGNPNAIIVVTHNAGQTSFPPGLIGAPAIPNVYYDDANVCGNAANRWVIHGSDHTLTDNDRFNVFIEKP